MAEKVAPAPLTKEECNDWRTRLEVLLHDANLGTTLRWRQELRALATIDNLRAVNTQLLEALEGNTIDGHIFGCPAGWQADRICSPLCLSTNAAIELARKEANTP